ncbi:hypothetical protein HPB50_014082 [Hyalomma asiaticum]|uniref:Uncharacterized protein n=1 Tax=Hyalomma asiaticum TaxID=266040 RepID=A0ACB7S6W3_HYAAI|nr:hypothetical protein HPB50_014082 [Hyalomma asiaticum]
MPEDTGYAPFKKEEVAIKERATLCLARQAPSSSLTPFLSHKPTRQSGAWLLLDVAPMRLSGYLRSVVPLGHSNPIGLRGEYSPTQGTPGWHPVNSNAANSMSFLFVASVFLTFVTFILYMLGHNRLHRSQASVPFIQASKVIGSIQLGIGYAVGSLASKPERNLLIRDFAVIESIFLPGEGSNVTPAHHYSDFKFKAYAPVAFRYFRDLFSINTQDFLMSLCHEPLRELSNPGASGSAFYLTNNDEFIIKTVQHKEAEFLQNLLAGYYMNLNHNPRTLLPKFYGLYCYQCGGKSVRVVVMNNLLPSVVPMHQKFDLKGSTYKRKASKHERSKRFPTFKDLDFLEQHPEGILLEADTYNALIKTIQRDCQARPCSYYAAHVLESFKIMDYSLLIGIHNIDQAAKEQERQPQGVKDEVKLSAAATEDDSSFRPAGSALTQNRATNRQRLANFSTAMESIQADVEPIDHDEDVPTGGIPAKNSKGERLLLFIGVIDILQSYRLLKKIEHTCKSLFHDKDTISVQRPSFYAERFQDFLAKKVFKKITSSTVVQDQAATDEVPESPSHTAKAGARQRTSRIKSQVSVVASP